MFYGEYMGNNDKPSLKRNPRYDKQKSKSLDIPQIEIGDIPSIPKKPVLLIVCLVILVLLMLFTVDMIDNSNSSNNNSTNNNDEVEEIVATTTLLGNNSLGRVYKEGPYGNTSSNIKIAYILGVHPREKGAHRLMEQAFKEKEANLKYCYYIYRINVTQDPTDYSDSRLNGQKLANEYIVPDAINNNFTFAVDAHYSNGAWGVSRFVFTPSKDNELSYQLGNALADNFDWLSYYTPPNPTSPKYVTSPLNNGGVGAIIYEAYTQDDNNVTLDHDRQIVDFIDNWSFNSSINNTTE